MDENTEVDPERENRIRKLEALLSKTVANGCTEEEMNSSQAAAQRLMEKWAIEDGDLGIGQKYRLYEQELKVSHADSPWRRRVIAAVASNTGVYFLGVGVSSKSRHRFNKGTMGTGYGRAVLAGQEHAVKGAALVAEYLLRTIEDLSSSYARTSGSGQTGRRQFAKSCAIRTSQRIRESFNLSGDPQLPLIISNSAELAKSAMMEKRPDIRPMSITLSLSGSEHEAAGRRAAESIDLRGHARSRRIEG